MIFGVSLIVPPGNRNQNTNSPETRPTWDRHWEGIPFFRRPGSFSQVGLWPEEDMRKSRIYGPWGVKGRVYSGLCEGPDSPWEGTLVGEFPFVTVTITLVGNQPSHWFPTDKQPKKLLKTYTLDSDRKGTSEDTTPYFRSHSSLLSLPCPVP